MIVTLTGRTCSGKSTLAAALKAKGWGSVVSHTTRPPREGELDGSSYHFVMMDEFISLYAKGAMIEKNAFGGHYYGVSSAAVTRAYKDHANVVMVVDPNGAHAVKLFCRKSGLDCRTVWLDERPEVMARRWLDRATGQTTEVSVARLAAMIDEEPNWQRGAGLSNLYHMVLDSSELADTNLAVELIEKMAK